MSSSLMFPTIEKALVILRGCPNGMSTGTYHRDLTQGTLKETHMSAAADLRASLIERGFITPNPTPTPAPIEPINWYQRGTLTVQNNDFEDDPSARDQFIDVYHDRFAGPVVIYSRDGVREGRNGERWQLPPLKNQWQHDWRRRVEAGQPALRLRAPRWAYYGDS